MKPTKILSIVFILFFAVSCQNGKKSKTNFKTDTLYEIYNLKVPTFLNKFSPGQWTFSDNNNNTLILNISKSPKNDNNSIENQLRSLISDNSDDMYKNKSFVDSKSLEFNDFKGQLKNYKKNNTSGMFPVMTYFTFAVFTDDKYTITVDAVSLGKNFSEDVLTTIQSIQKVQTKENDSVSKDTISSVEKDTMDALEKTKINLKQLEQQGYQVFAKDDFAVKCNCTIKINSIAIKMAKEQGNPYPLSSYVCAENEDSFEKGVIYNIQISDMTKDFNSLPQGSSEIFINQYLDKYTDNLTANGISNIQKEFNGLKSIQYTFEQNGLPAKALIFMKNKKSYLLQVSTRDDLNLKYKNLTESFTFIN